MNLQQNANYQLMSYIMRWQKKKKKKAYTKGIFTRDYTIQR